MRDKLLAALLVVPAPAALLIGAGSPAPQDAASTFKGRCSGCHIPADPAFKTDKAWLSQILETA